MFCCSQQFYHDHPVVRIEPDDVATSDDSPQATDDTKHPSITEEQPVKTEVCGSNLSAEEFLKFTCG